jgi:hypothetical protein
LGYGSPESGEAIAGTVECIAWIEDAIEIYRAIGSMLLISFFLALKAEGLHLPDRTSEALEAIRTRKKISVTT